MSGLRRRIDKERRMAEIFPWYRLGYIIPHRHTDMDGYQFARVAPDGMMLVTTQLDLREYSLAAVEEQLPTLREAVDILGRRKVDSMSISGVPLAASLGRARTRELLDDASSRSGIECLTDLEAHIEALQALGASRIALATRWPDALNARIRDYLREAGVEVLVTVAEQRDLQQNKAASPEADHELALRLGREAMAAAPDAQALLLPGGLWFAIHAAPRLEAEFGVPVLLNITSTVWAALRSASAPLPVATPGSGWAALAATLNWNRESH
jgi:arylmalonate decarboxylase